LYNCSKIFGDFCHIAAKGVIVKSVNAGVSGPNVTKIVHNIEKFILFNHLKSELRYCNPFRNGSATKEIGPVKNAYFSTLIGWHES